jgi:hypothetical protein
VHRFPWAAWGLLVVVIDLPLRGWDVAPDVVGYAWILYGLLGATARPFLVARVAAVVGLPVWLVTGTPLFADDRWVILQYTALTVEAVVWAVLVHQLCTGVMAVGIPDDLATWAHRLALAAVALGVLLVGSLVLYATSGLALYGVAVVAAVVVGLLTVVLLQRVARSGALTTA